jgi:effector-binding domain-containing protein
MSRWVVRSGMSVVLILALAGPVLAQAPATPAPADPAPPSAPPATPAPATPAPPTAATPAPGAPAAAADGFAVETMLTARNVVVSKGTATWDNAFDTITGALKSIMTVLDRQGIKPAGNSQIIYTATDDTGFTFEAQVPVEETPKNLPRNLSVGKSPEGKALRFTHRGSYDNMDNTYEAITNHLDDKQLEAQDMFVEEYVTDPLKTPEDKLTINIYVPLK